MSSREKTIVAAIVAVVVLVSLVWAVTTKDDRLARRAAAEREQELREAPPSSAKPHVANPFASSELLFDYVCARKGKWLFEEVISKYPQLDDFYRSVDRSGMSRGFGAFISLPIDAWKGLDDEQRLDLGHFMSRESPFNGWAIYIGAINGGDVMSDSTGLSSQEWELRKEPDARYEDVAARRGETDKRAAIHRAMRDGEPGPVSGVTAMLLYSEARDLVRERLKSPRGSKFASASDRSSVSVRRLAGGDVEVRGWVDAQNSFGANVRTHWTATIHPNDWGGWSILTLDITP